MYENAQNVIALSGGKHRWHSVWLTGAAATVLVLGLAFTFRWGLTFASAESAEHAPLSASQHADAVQTGKLRPHCSVAD